MLIFIRDILFSFIRVWFHWLCSAQPRSCAVFVVVVAVVSAVVFGVVAAVAVSHILHFN